MASGLSGPASPEHKLYLTAVETQTVADVRCGLHGFAELEWYTPNSHTHTPYIFYHCSINDNDDDVYFVWLCIA